jgi:GNAT superfamily N-acetyltransferase
LGVARGRPTPKLRFALATAADFRAIVRVRDAAAARLTAAHGHGHWSAGTSEGAVEYGLRHAKGVLAKRGRRLLGTLRLATKKPWAIDVAWFTPVKRALYLLDMAVDPGAQREGVGRALLEHAREVARAWPADAIRLDAYDAPAGAGPFYAKCGYRECGRVTYRGVPLLYYELVL